MNCLSKKVQRNKCILEEERYAAKIKAMSPDERAELDRRYQEAMRSLASMRAVSTLAGQTPYADEVSVKPKFIDN